MTARPKLANPRPDFATLLAAAKLPEKTVVVCLRGDLVAEHEELERQLEQADNKASDSLAGNGAAEIAERIEALQDEMRASSYSFRLRALSGPAYRSFTADYPIRREEDGTAKREDLHFGFNMDTGFEPLTRLCLVDPEPTDDVWARLMDTLTDRQFDDIAMAAFTLNRGEIDIPFSRAASRLRRPSGDESKPLTD